MCVSGGWNVDRAERWRVVIENSTTTINVSLNLLDASKDGGYIFKNKSPKRFNNFNARRLRVIECLLHTYISGDNISYSRRGEWNRLKCNVSSTLSLSGRFEMSNAKPATREREKTTLRVHIKTKLKNMCVEECSRAAWYLVWDILLLHLRSDLHLTLLDSYVSPAVSSSQRKSFEFYFSISFEMNFGESGRDPRGIRQGRRLFTWQRLSPSLCSHNKRLLSRETEIYADGGERRARKLFRLSTWWKKGGTTSRQPILVHLGILRGRSWEKIDRSSCAVRISETRFSFLIWWGNEIEKLSAEFKKQDENQVPTKNL